MIPAAFKRTVLVLASFLLCGSGAQADLPPVPVPTENPITEEKRVLGKILFWDEQLSTDNTVACGTCHAPAAAGADTRMGAHPGLDGLFATADDVVGSPGVVHRDITGAPMVDVVFGTGVQVTGRLAPNFFGAIFGDEQFWDGRAGSQFLDPLDGTTVVIAAGGSLESQAVGPILSPVEMAKDGRTWQDVTDKLAGVVPLEFASGVPADISAVLTPGTTYGDLFDDAFGDAAITPVRIAFAIATYERTLVPDESPFDLGTLNGQEQAGFNFLFGLAGEGPAGPPTCLVCHGGLSQTVNTFSDHSYRNIGVAFDPITNDLGRETVTGAAADRAAFKVPTLRNVGVKPAFMHDGDMTTLGQVITFYQPGRQNSVVNIDPLIPSLVAPAEVASLIAFLSTGLTDPRVAAGSFPFDAPTLNAAGELVFDAQAVPGLSLLAMLLLTGALARVGYRGRRAA